jgi:hypothetical protein
MRMMAGPDWAGHHADRIDLDGITENDDGWA